MFGGSFNRGMGMYRTATAADLLAKTPASADDNEKTEYGKNPPNPEEAETVNDTASEDDNIIVEDDTSEENVVIEENSENDENEEEDEMAGKPKQFMEKEDLKEVLAEIVDSAWSEDELTDAVLELCTTVYIKSAQDESHNDLNETLRSAGFKPMEVLKIVQGLMQPTVEATEEVMVKLLEKREQAPIDTSTAIPVPAPFDGSGTGPKIIIHSINGQPPEKEDEDKGNPYLENLLNGLNAEPEDKSGDQDKTGNNTGENAGKPPKKMGIAYADFRRQIASDFSYMAQITYESVTNNGIYPWMADFIENQLHLSIREWVSKSIFQQATDKHIKEYCDYLLDTMYEITDCTVEDGETVNVQCPVCAEEKDIPGVFQIICNSNPGFTFIDAMFFLNNYVIFGRPVNATVFSLNNPELQKVYNEIKRKRERTSKDTSGADPNSTKSSDAWKVITGDGGDDEEPDDKGEDDETEDEEAEDEKPEKKDETKGRGKKTSRKTNEPEKPEKTKRSKKRGRDDFPEEYEDDPRFERPNGGIGKIFLCVIGILGLCAVLGLVVYFGFSFFKSFMSDEDDGWADQPAAQQQITEQAADEGMTEDTQDTEDAAGTDEGNNTTDAGIGLEITGSDTASTADAAQAEESNEEVSQDEAELESFVVSAVAMYPGTVFDLPANQFGALVKQEDGLYSCLTKVTADQAQAMVTEMQKNEETSHALRYIALPETGLYMTQSISLEDAKKIATGEYDGFPTSFDERGLTSGRVDVNGNKYIVYMRYTIEEVKTMLDNSSENDEYVDGNNGMILMITDNYAASYTINRAALKQIYDRMVNVGAKEVIATKSFDKEAVDKGNILNSNL